MHILIPKFHPVAWLSIFAFYVLCLLEGGDPDPGLVFSIDPITGAIVGGTAVALGLTSAIAGNKREKRAIAAQKAAERKRRQAIKKAMGPEARRAQKRLKRGKYGFSQAKQREGTEEIQHSAEAQAKGQRAELERGEGPYGSGRREALKRALSQQQQSTVAQGRLGTARLSEQVGAQQQAADRSTVTQYGQALGGLQSAVPGMMMQSKSGAERFADIGMQGLTAAATLGAFSGGGGSAGGGTGTGTGADGGGAAAQYAKGDTGTGAVK